MQRAETQMRLKIVEITWLDAYSEAGWKDIDKMSMVPLPVITSVGYLIEKNDRVVRLAHSINTDQCDFTLIPAGTVSRVRTIGHVTL